MSKTTIPRGGITADAIDATLVTDDAISDEHLDVTAVTGQTAITSLADTDKFLVSDASDSGNLKYVEKQYLGGGAFNFISSTTVGAVTNFYINNCFSSTYQNYMIVVQNLMANADGNLRMRLLSSGSFINDANYRFAGTGFDRGGSARTYSGHDNTSFNISNSADGDDANSATFGIYYLSSPYISDNPRKNITGHYKNSHTGGNSIDATYNFAGTLEKASLSADGLFFFCDGSGADFRSGNASTGKGLIKIYGISDS